MKKLRVDGVDVDVEAIQAELDAINRGATSFTITDPAKLTNFARLAEKMLTSYDIAKSDRPGAKLVLRPSGPAANSYKYAVITTEVTLTRTRSGWYMTDVKRAKVYPKSRQRLDITITDRAANNMVKRSLAMFGRVAA
jgi:hypothetical protein